MARKKDKAQLRADARNRPPLRIVAIEPDGENLVIRADGTMRAAARVIIHEDDIGAVRAGYYCANCFEAQSEAFPVECWLCKFQMRDKQSELIAKGYQGSMRIGPQTNADTELAAMEEWHEKQRRGQDPRSAASQILLPGKDF